MNREDLLVSITEGSVSIQGYDGVSAKATTIGHVNGIGKAVLVRDAPNNLINLRKLCKEINGKYEGDYTSMTIYDEDGEIYLW